MDLLIDFAKNVYYNCLKLPHDPETNYSIMMRDFKDFTSTYPLIVKYMCLYKIFDENLFKNLLETQNKSRLKYEQTFEVQADYIKHLLIKNGVNKMEAKKEANKELDLILTKINKIKKTEKNFNAKSKKIKSDNFKEIRQETLDFINTI